MEGKEFSVSKASEAVLRKYYKGYHRTFSLRMQYFYSRQVQEVCEQIKARPGCRLLDIGCGLGTESMWFALQGADVTALDLKNERLNVARERLHIL